MRCLAVLHAVHVGVEAQVLLGGEVRVQHGVVRDEADGLAHRHGVLAHVVAGHLDLAAAGGEQRGEHAQGGRLAGAVGAEDAQEPAARHPERDALEHLTAAERLAQALDLDLEGSPAVLPVLVVRHRRAHLGGRVRLDALGDARLLLLLPALGPEGDDGADDEQDRADPDPADEREDDQAQGDRLGGAVERLVGDDEEVLERAPHDHRAHGGAADRVDVGVRLEHAERLAVPRDVEGGGALGGALRAGAVGHALVRERVAAEAGGRARLDLDDGRVLDLVSRWSPAGRRRRAPCPCARRRPPYACGCR